MHQVDKKDRKILFELHLNSRQSYQSIARKVGLSKDMVIYRIQRLVTKGIIKNFRTEIDEYKLGKSLIRLYYNLQFTDASIKKKMISSFSNYKNIRGIHLCVGHFDFNVVMSVESIPEFYNKWGEHVLTRYKNYIDNQIFSIICLITVFKPTYLMSEDSERRRNRKKYILYGDGTRVIIDKFDKMLLDVIAVNARMPLITIAKKMNSTSRRVKNRIEHLKDLGVIKGYTIGINYDKLGLNIYKVDVTLKDHEKLNQIINYIKENPNLEWIIKSIGYVDVEFKLILNNSKELIQIMDDLSNKFPDTIKNYEFYKIIESYKLQMWES